MTKLEEEILIAQQEVRYNSDPTSYAKAAAEVAKRWMDKAWEGAVKRRVYKGDVYTITFDEWLKENEI